MDTAFSRTYTAKPIEKGGSGCGSTIFGGGSLGGGLGFLLMTAMGFIIIRKKQQKQEQ